jgi:hypothetical protein
LKETNAFDWFEHPDGSIIYRRESTFHWEHFNSDGYLTMRYWVAPKVLDKGALECPTDVWEAFREYPDSYSMIAEWSNQVFELPGRKLLKLVESEMLTLFPAAYRLVFRN